MHEGEQYTHSADSEETLRQVARRIDQITDPTVQANLIAASAILAGIKLEEEVIYRLLRRDIMQESVIYQSIQREAEKRAEVRKQREIAANFLRDGLPVEAVARGTGLSIEEVQQLQQQLNGSVVARIGCPRSTSPADMSAIEQGQHAPNYSHSAQRFVFYKPSISALIRSIATPTPC